MEGNLDDHDHFSILESVAEGNSEANPYKEDRINSGESKFKYYSFEPNTTRTSNDIERCLDFWQFINKNSQLFPHKGTRISTTKTVNNSQQEEDLNWSNVLDLLKSKQLDKVAKYAKTHKKQCTITRCSDESNAKHKKGQIDSDDEFNLNNLKDFDPQKKYYEDKEVQTIEIVVADVSTQTEFPSSKLRIQQAMDELDLILKKVADEDLTGYFDCICDPKATCECLQYPTQTASENDKKQGKTLENKCTCSCGNVNCLCSVCDQILKEIEKAQSQFNGLDSFEIESCPCADIACACLEDYKMLLDIKLEINKAIVESVGDPNAEFHMPIHCQCSCNQMNCPCKIVSKLFIQLDELLGYKEKPLYYSDDNFNLRYAVHVCRCNDYGEEAEPPCMCLSFFRRNIKDKIDAMQASETKLAKDDCECMTSCTHTCCTDESKSPIKCEELSEHSDVPCLCDQQECLKTEGTSESLIMVVSYNSDVAPEVPPNSIVEN